MKKYFKYYGIVWGVIFIIFLLATLLIKQNTTGLDNAGGSFWVGFILACLAFIGNLGVSAMLFTEENGNKVFLSIPIVAVSFIALIFSFIVSVIVMIADLPVWVAVIIDAVVLGGYIIAVNATTTHKQMVSDIEKNVLEATQTMRLLTATANSLQTRAQTNEMRAEAHKVYEAIRFADPMSNASLAPIENQISAEVNRFAIAVDTNDIALAQALSTAIVNDVALRNESCKVYKQYNNNVF